MIAIVLGPASLPTPPSLAESETPCADIHAVSPAPVRALILTVGGMHHRKDRLPGRTTGGPAIHLVSVMLEGLKLSAALDSSRELYEAILGA
jgi:hypothetical protein